MQNSADALAISIDYVPPVASTAQIANSSYVGKFERLPKWLNCVPLVIQWLWLSLRYSSVSLPSVANPHITCGGMVGESKQEYFNCMGDFGRGYIAPFIAISVRNKLALEQAISAMHKQHMHFPVVVKPDLGWCGYGVRRINDVRALASYLEKFPQGQTILLQRYLPEAGEAGVFYMRHPEQEKGDILGVLFRYYPQVIGDGVHTIAQLIAKDARLQRISQNKLHQPDYTPEAIPAPGEEVRLALIGSTRIGGLYCDGSEYITTQLIEVFDRIAKDMPEFYAGRFDIRYESLERLRQGKGFTIMEVNGAGSEAVHAWDPKYSIRESYRIIFAKQRLLFQIGAVNRKRGYRPIGLSRLAKLHFFQQALIKRYPLSN